MCFVFTCFLTVKISCAVIVLVIIILIIMNTQLKPIKEIAFQVLVYLYGLDRASDCDLSVIHFNFLSQGAFGHDVKFTIHERFKKIQDDLLEIANGVDNDLLKGFKNILDNNLIEGIFIPGCKFMNLKLTSLGYDMVESLQTDEGRYLIEKNLNIKFAPSFTFNIRLDSIMSFALSLFNR